MKVAISIVNYNTAKLTSDCIKSILSRKWKVDLDIFVIDNASSDGSLEILKKEFPKLHFIDSKKNNGFGAGHNLALKETKCDFNIILNSDALVESDVIDSMVDFMVENSECGIASCRVIGFDGKLQPNAGDLPFGLSLINWLFNLEALGIKRPAFHITDESYYKDKKEVGWLSGNFMIIRREVIEKVGFFNESYFMYFEDVEFCYRISKAGFKVMFNPSTSIKHLSGGSLDNPRFRQWTGEYKGLVHFYKDQFGLFAGIIVKSLVYITSVLRLIAFFITGKLDFSKTYAKVIANI
jgi:GT2 family glycosyltransferase